MYRHIKVKLKTLFYVICKLVSDSLISCSCQLFRHFFSRCTCSIYFHKHLRATFSCSFTLHIWTESRREMMVGKGREVENSLRHHSFPGVIKNNIFAIFWIKYWWGEGNIEMGYKIAYKNKKLHENIAKL